MKAQAYNEKLKIEPIKKGGLANRFFPNGNWKSMLKTGDIVVMAHSNYGDDIDEASFYFYVSQESLEKYNYNKIFDISTLDDYDISEGIIVRKNYNGNTPKFTYDCISAYGDKYPQIERLHSVTFVHKIFRNDLLKEPLGEDLFCASLVAIQYYVKKCRTVFSYKPQNISEKLQIQPVSKERLEKLKTKTVKIGNLVWTAENAKTLVTHSGSPLVNGKDYFVENGEVYYTYEAAMSVVPNGWRLPTKEDVNNTFGFCNGNILDLISIEYGGNDKYGLNIKLLGIHTPTKVIGNGMYTNLVRGYNPRTNPMQTGKVKSIKIVGRGLKEEGGCWGEVLSARYGMSLRFVRNI